MDFLKQQGQKIREQLSGLSPSQKMLAGSLVVIMVMTLAWWSRYAGTSEMVALLEQDFSDENLSRATLLLKREQIPYKVVGKRLHVPVDRQFDAIAHLGFEQLLPQDTSSGWEQIIEKMDSPWNPQSKQDEVFNHAKEAVLGQVLRAVPGVRGARVVIDNKQKRSFGEGDREPTAVVQLQTNDPAKSQKKLAEVAANVVAGAVSGLRRSRVNVIIDGASYDVRDKGGDDFAGGADEVMEAIQTGERYYTEKLEKPLRRIHPGIMVLVTVDPKTSSSQMERQEYDKSKTFNQPVETTDRTEENTSSSRSPAEPGAVPNVGASGGANQPLSIGAAGGGGEGTSNSVTENNSKNQVFPSMVKEWTRNPAGSMTVVGASISVPRSHFVNIFKQSYPDAKEPDESALGPIIDKEMPVIERVALGALPIAADKVKTSVFYDYLPAGVPEAGAQVASATGFGLGAIQSYGREIALGSLAVVSLFMVSMMVRKGTPVAVAPPRVERQPPTPMPPPEHVAGEATQGDQTMEAVEIDDQAVKTQQMIGQVQNMVRENPDGAANLVKRWLNRA
jgi:flagellar biosynthesis/type III secretory pathway M-ring protein FliF/YscJ